MSADNASLVLSMSLLWGSMLIWICGDFLSFSPLSLHLHLHCPWPYLALLHLLSVLIFLFNPHLGILVLLVDPLSAPMLN